MLARVRSGGKAQKEAIVKFPLAGIATCKCKTNGVDMYVFFHSGVRAVRAYMVVSGVGAGNRPWLCATAWIYDQL